MASNHADSAILTVNPAPPTSEINEVSNVIINREHICLTPTTSDLRKRNRSSDSTNLSPSTPPAHTHKKHKLQTSPTLNAIAFELFTEQLTQQSPEHACAITLTTQNGAQLPSSSAPVISQISLELTQPTTNNVSTYLPNITLDSYLELYSSQSTFSSHLEDLSASKKYEAEHQRQISPHLDRVLLEVPNFVDILPTTVPPEIPGTSSSITHTTHTTTTSPSSTVSNTISTTNDTTSHFPHLREMISNFATSFQVSHQLSRDAQIAIREVIQLQNVPPLASPPAPPQAILLTSPFPEEAPLNLPRPDFPLGVTWPLQYSYEPARVMTGPILNDLTKSIKSQRRVDFLRESLAREQLPLWSLGMEPIPPHWTPSEHTKVTVLNLVRENARAVTTAVMSGMKHDSVKARETFKERLAHIKKTDTISVPEKEATATMMTYIENISVNQINRTLHKQWKFLEKAQPTDHELAKVWFQPPTATDPPTTSRPRTTAAAPRDRQPRSAQPVRAQQQNRRPQPSRSPRRSRSPRPAPRRDNFPRQAPQNFNQRSSRQPQQSRRDFQEYQSFLDFKKWQDNRKNF